jgi:hypothetical protein
VRLRREVGRFPAGIEAAIVQVFPEQYACGLELFESPARTIRLVAASADDLRASLKRGIHFAPLRAWRTAAG